MLDLLELSFFLEDDDDDEFVVSGVFFKGKTGSSGWAVVGKERDPLAIVAPTKIPPHSAVLRKNTHQNRNKNRKKVD